MNDRAGDNSRITGEARRGGFSRGAMLALAAALVVILALAIGLNVGGLRERLLGGGVPRIEAIAILPFENLSKDPGQAYFAQGMTNIFNTLYMGLIESVRPIAATSVAQYRKSPKPLPEIARELGIDAVIEGGVLRTGDRVQFTVSLMHAPTNRRLWGQTYERELRDLSSLRAEVCLAIARKIKARLTPREEAILTSRAPVNPQAEDALMRGMWGGNPAKTEELLKQAVQLDPSYAAGYDFLAQTYSMRLMYPAPVAPKDIYPKAREAGEKAISLDPNVILSHRVLGTVALEYDWNLIEAEKELKLGLEFAPHGSNAHHQYAHYLLSLGRMEEASAETRQAMEVDPLNPTLFACASWHDIAAGNYEEAEKHALQTLSLGAPDQLARLTLGWSYLLRGRHNEAIPEFQKAVVGWQNAAFPTAALGHAYAVAGQESAAREVLARLLERAKTEYVSAYEIATIYAGLGDKDRAFEWLGKALEERATLLVYFRMDPRIWSLRSDPRFQDLLRRMNFPQQQ